jgi:hypothetical protein
MPFWDSRPKDDEGADEARPGAAEAAKTKKKKAKG